MSKKIGMISLGCPKNQVDAEIMLAQLQNNGFEIVTDPYDADVVIVDILFDSFRELFKCRILIFISVKHLILHPAKERFHNTVVVTVSFPGHGLDDLLVFQGWQYQMKE